MTVTVVESYGAAVTSSNEAATLATPPAADGTDALLVVHVGQVGIGITTLTVNGDGTRDYIELVASGSSGAVDSDVIVRMYPLLSGDEYVVLTPTNPYVGSCWGIYQLQDFAAIPADLSAQVASETFVPTQVLEVNTTMIAPGLLVAAAAISFPSDTVPTMTVPAGYTELVAEVGPFGEYQILANTEAGVVADTWTAGTVPTSGEGLVVTFGAHDVGLRHREGGAYVGSGMYGMGGQLDTPPARQFPPDEELPATAPDPSPIVVPTPPWVPTDGPYRNG